MLKDCFAGIPSIHIDPHQQITGLNAKQLIQFASAIGLGVLLATFRKLED